MKSKRHNSLALVAISAFSLIFLGTGAFVFWLWQLAQELDQQIAEKKFLPPTTFYSAPSEIAAGASLDDVVSELQSRNYRERAPSLDSTQGEVSASMQQQALLPGEFRRIFASPCTSRPKSEQESTAIREFVCLQLRLSANQDPDLKQNQFQEVTFVRSTENRDSQFRAIEFFGRDKQTAQDPSQNEESRRQRLMLESEVLAQFLEDEPILQRWTQLGEIPNACLRSVLAAEDSAFLNHPGVSLTSILRAVWVNVVGRRSQQGGSTITQQLVKNRFLTSEKTIRRKWLEFWMSLLLEFRFTKDQILETYLNIIYMGQNGPFQVRGFGAAADHYFRKPLQKLSLGECSTLASLLNSPGLFDPWKNPAKLLQRRRNTLERMQNLKWISAEEMRTADLEPISPAPSVHAMGSSSLAYSVDFVRTELKNRFPDVKKNDFASVYTSLQPKSQARAQTALSKQLVALETSDAHLQKLRQKGKRLEGAALVVDLKKQQVLAAIGGRDFHISQFNRSHSAHRQIGSLIKPWVFLQSLIRGGQPTDMLDDSPFTHEFGKQSWSPQNYGDKYFGTVPAFFALAQSLNCATAKLSLELGVEGLVDLIKKSGGPSNIQPHPSISLGALEMTLPEVAQMYSSLARFGSRMEISSVRGWTSHAGEIHTVERASESVFEPQKAGVLISMMEETLAGGTAASAQRLGFHRLAAGKTGTTSDYRDAWFAGFTPELLSVVWVGIDDNTSSNLTGGRGALPIWVEIMNAESNTLGSSASLDFSWPEGLRDIEAKDPKADSRMVKLKRE